MSVKLTDYLSNLTVTQGRHAGQPFRVLPWQHRFTVGAFADGIQSAALSVGRGNGKTALLSGIAAATLDGPLRVPRGETVIVASSFGQARIAFEHVLHFLGDKLADRSQFRTQDTMQSASIEHRPSGAKVRVVGSDPKRAHGLAPVLVLADEPSQWPESTGERMLAALRTAAGKQPHYRFVALGTRPADESHWFAKMLAGGCEYAQCHAAKPADPKWQKRTWAKANPSMQHMPDLEAAIRTEAAEAKLDPALLAGFDALRLNLGTSDVAEALLLTAGTWRRIEGQAEASGRVVWGADMGTSEAMSAIAGYWPDTGRLEVVAAFPELPSLAERGLRDGVGSLYQQMAREGNVIQCGKWAVEYAPLLEEALRRFGAPSAVICDRWREKELRGALDAAGVPAAGLVIRGQGYRDGGADVRDFRRACVSDKVTPLPSLLLRHAMSEARVARPDPAGNVKLAKKSENGRRMRARDDAVAASILAVAEGSRIAARRRPPRPFRMVAIG